jgi:hypothetical protein
MRRKNVIGIPSSNYIICIVIFELLRRMEKYRKLKVIGKGSFGYAVLVQSVIDRQTYVMKVKTKY